jgi:cystathionine beta-lyase/cystathionine gamma-synthase
VRHQNDSALVLASWLEKHPSVRRVHYPFLPSHPHHDRARSLLSGAGGVVSFELEGGVEAAQRLISRVSIAIHAPSLGGVETLITRPATTSHAGLSPEDRAARGISDALVRVSIGLEAIEDLIRDFSHALG